MSRRLVGALLALLLATVGTVILVAYVRAAEQRALAGQELVEVYLVTDTIPAGTPAEEIGDRVAIERVPAMVRPVGAVDDLASLGGLVAAVDLPPGEQLLRTRFVERAQFGGREAGIDVPDDMVEVTVAFDPERAVGGLLEPGQTVAVFASFDPFQLTASVVEVDGEQVPLPGAVAAEVGGTTPNSTDLLLRKVLVTAVQQPPDTPGGPGDPERLTVAPDDEVYVTLAVRPFDAERLVFTAEFGRLWLAVERDTVPESEDPIQTRGSVLLDQTNNP